MRTNAEQSGLHRSDVDRERPDGRDVAASSHWQQAASGTRSIVLNGDDISRRAFVGAGLTAMGGLALGWPVRQALGQTADLGGMRRSPVVQVRSHELVTLHGIHEELLGDLLDVALRRLTGLDDLTEAWSRFIKPDDVVALKFDLTGAEALATTPTLLAVLTRSLESAGLGRKRIVAVDVPSELAAEVGVQSARWGWTDNEYDFGSGRDRLAVWLNDVTAIINVPSLMTHNITGLSGCLVNLAYSVVKHPAVAFGANGSPYVADIAALPVIRDKLRLNLVNGFRIVFDGGPLVREGSTWDAGILLASPDPVAADVVGLFLLNQGRSRVGLPPIGGESAEVAYLRHASEVGLGVSEMYQLELSKFKL